jgi:hypothetical protein
VNDAGVFVVVSFQGEIVNNIENVVHGITSLRPRYPSWARWDVGVHILLVGDGGGGAGGALGGGGGVVVVSCGEGNALNGFLRS